MFSDFTEDAQAVEVSVINSESGEDVAIPVEKSILNPDDKEHAFRFDLVQVTDATGATPVDGAETMSVDLAVTDTATLGSAFVLSYREKDIDELPTKLYYKVSEQVAEAQKGTVDFDETFYVLEVTLSKDGLSFKAKVTNAWKNGADKVADFVAASFSNVLLRDLTIQKELVVPEGLDASELTFGFTVALSGDQVAQNASYKATKVKADGTREELSEPVEFVNGTTKVTLRGGETLLIHGIPHESTWSVVEAEADGYSVKHQIMPVEETRVVAGADTGAQTLTDSATGVVFTNTGGYELPESGGFGTALHAICGVLAMLGAVVLFVIKRRNGRESMALSGK